MPYSFILRFFYEQPPKSPLSDQFMEDGHSFQFTENRGSGGSKIVYATNTGRVVYFPQPEIISRWGMDRWKQITESEITISEKLKEIGLQTYNPQSCKITIGTQKPFETFQAKDFQVMAQEGNHILPVKGSIREDGPNLFFKKRNWENPNYWLNLLANVCKDIAIMINNDIQIRSNDSINYLVCPNGEKLPRVCFFFSDFSKKEQQVTLNNLRHQWTEKDIKEYLDYVINDIKCIISTKEENELKGEKERLLLDERIQEKIKLQLLNQTKLEVVKMILIEKGFLPTSTSINNAEDLIKYVLKNPMRQIKPEFANMTLDELKKAYRDKRAAQWAGFKLTQGKPLPLISCCLWSSHAYKVLDADSISDFIKTLNTNASANGVSQTMLKSKEDNESELQMLCKNLVKSLALKPNCLASLTHQQIQSHNLRP